MVERGCGRIFNLGSLHGSQAWIEHSAYAASKAAIEALTRVMAIELAPKGVLVNCIIPGWCLTENQLPTLPINPDYDLLASGIPAGRISSPSDIGSFIVGLCGEWANYLVGQSLKFTGGSELLMRSGGEFRKPLDVKFGEAYVKRG